MELSPYIIGITGGSASGKTSFLHHLKDAFATTEVCVVSQDNYYKELHHQESDENGYVNYDLPTSIDVERFKLDLSKLKQQQAITKTEYVFNNPNKKPEIIHVHPAPIIIVEGLFIYYFEEISNQLDLKVFVDADEDIKFQRRMKRDTEERGIHEDLVKYQWDNHVQPAYEKYLLPFKSKSDLIITNNESYQKSLQVLIHHLKHLIQHHYQKNLL